MAAVGIVRHGQAGRIENPAFRTEGFQQAGCFLGQQPAVGALTIGAIEQQNADRLAPEAIPHLPEALNVLTQPLGIAVQGVFQDLAHPFRQLRVQAVVNPLPLATILQQTATAQHGQVPGDLRLCRFQCRGQLTDTQLLLVSHQKNNARPRLIGQAFEYLDWRYEVAAIGGFIWLYLAHADPYQRCIRANILLLPNIWQSEYSAQ